MKVLQNSLNGTEQNDMKYKFSLKYGFIFKIHNRELYKSPIPKNKSNLIDTESGFKRFRKV